MSRFTEAVKAGLNGLEYVSTGPCPGCEKCGLKDLTDADEDPDRYELAGEPSFSWRECDTCRSRFGGDRHPAHGVIPEDSDFLPGELVHLNICTDCLMFIANGDEPEEWYSSPADAQHRREVESLNERWS